jgi:nucleotide-binding universal stress UspA family protein
VTGFRQTVVVGFDGSDAARHALERVVDVARDGARVVLVTAAESLYSEPWSSQVDPRELERRDGTLSSGHAFLAERGIDAITVPAIGDPADAILEAAREAKRT